MAETIASIKARLDQRIGDHVRVTAQAGRKRVTKHEGILSKTYPAVFIIHLSDDDGDVQRVSYSYTDLLTNNVSIEFEDDVATEE